MEFLNRFCDRPIRIFAARTCASFALSAEKSRWKIMMMDVDTFKDDNLYELGLGTWVLPAPGKRLLAKIPDDEKKTGRVPEEAAKSRSARAWCFFVLLILSCQATRHSDQRRSEPSPARRNAERMNRRTATAALAGSAWWLEYARRSWRTRTSVS